MPIKLSDRSWRNTRKKRGLAWGKTVAGLLPLLDEHYQESEKEREMIATDKWMDFRRMSSEEIQIFWLRFEALLARVELSQNGLSADMIFTRALKALNLSPMQRTSVLMTIDAQSLPRNITQLGKCTIRLFGPYRSIQSTAGKSSINTFSAEADELALVDENDMSELYLVKKKKTTTRNRPGMEKLAAKQAGSAMNMGSEVFLGKGMRHYRCGKTDHILRGCPVPYTKTLAFSPQKTAKEVESRKMSKVLCAPNPKITQKKPSLRDQLIPPPYLKRNSRNPLINPAWRMTLVCPTNG